MLVSPAEPLPLRQLGEVSSTVESYGADFLFLPGGGKGVIGVQRKEVSDLVASLRDQRFSKELEQLGRCNTAVLLVEGLWPWEGGRKLFGRYSFGEWEGFEMSVQLHDVKLIRTVNLDATKTRLPRLETFFTHQVHDSLLRPPTMRAVPGELRPLCAIEGVNLKVAKAIRGHFGRIPLQWTCTVEEMVGVPGIGKGRARKLSTHIPFA